MENYAPLPYSQMSRDNGTIKELIISLLIADSYYLNVAIDEKENDTENRLEEREKPLTCQTLLNEFLFNLIHENRVCG